MRIPSILCAAVILSCVIAINAESSGRLLNTADVTCLPTSFGFHSISDDCKVFSFRFVVLYDHRDSGDARMIGVFMDPAAFSEANLKELFGHFAAKYTEPRLTITVETDWGRLQPLSPGCPGRGESSSGTLPLEPADIFHARFFRRQGEEPFFRFNPEKKGYKKALIKPE